MTDHSEYSQTRQQDGVSTRHTDAVAAAVVAVVVWSLGRAQGHSPRTLLRPRPFLVGVGGAVTLEFGFARWPKQARRLWRRPLVRFGSPLALIVAVWGAGRHRSAGGEPRDTPCEPATPVTVVLGGLAGYALLLFGVVSGVLPEPATWFDGDRE